MHLLLCSAGGAGLHQGEGWGSAGGVISIYGLPANAANQTLDRGDKLSL